ncbi:MAG: YraN family protein [Desulfovibrio sp.]|nr:YraN family protein [Desulfovibrio sp.]MCA1985558.1 YraN family protein [Desulfovibrio sp.]
MPPPHLLLGQAGEAAAARHLEAAGLRILDRNWRDGRLELDIVCEARDGTLVFVEVRTRSPRSRGAPAETITPAKQRLLARAAAAWLSAHDSWHRACRFDVLAVCAPHPVRSHEINPEEAWIITHHPHAFEVADALDRGHAHWQPW